VAVSVTQNVTELSFASVRMCDCKRLSAHNFVDLSSDDPNHQRSVATSITATMSAVQSHTPNVTQTSWCTVAVHRRWGGSLWATTSVAVKRPTDIFVASHWLERPSSRSSVTLLVFSRADHSTLQVLTTSHVVFISTFYGRLVSKALQLIRPPPDWSTAVTSHAAVNSDARSIQISKYSDTPLSKHASSCSAIRPNYQSQPQLMGFTIQWSRLEPAY